MTLQERDEMIERALDRTNVAWRAWIGARNDMRRVGFTDAAEGAQKVMESMARVAAMIETRD